MSVAPEGEEREAFGDLVGEAPVALAVVDAELRFLAANAAFAATSGLAVAAHAGRPLEEVLTRAPAALATAIREVLAHGGRRTVAFRQAGARPADPVRRFVARIYPVAMPSGRCCGMVIDETTSAHRLERERRAARDEAEALTRALERLVESAPSLADTRDVPAAAAAICGAALETFECDVGALWVEADGGLELVVRVPAHPSLPPGTRLPFAAFAGVEASYRRGQPVFVADVERDEPGLWSEVVVDTGTHAQLRLPVRGEPGALIFAAWRQRLEAPDVPALAIAARFADHAAVALAEARRREAHDEVVRLHGRLAAGLLPTLVSIPADLELATLYRPGEARLTLGGDFFDVLPLADGRLALLIGDVSGHGPEAAALATLLRTAWQVLVPVLPDVGAVFAQLQDALARTGEADAFATVCHLEVAADRRSVRVALAGHPPPLLVTADGTTEIAATVAPPIGATVEATWRFDTVPLPEGATVLLYTDGLTDGRRTPGGSERLGESGLRALVERLALPIQTAALERLVADVIAANGGGLADDLAIMAISPVPSRREG